LIVLPGEEGKHAEEPPTRPHPVGEALPQGGGRPGAVADARDLDPRDQGAPVRNPAGRPRGHPGRGAARAPRRGV